MLHGFSSLPIFAGLFFFYIYVVVGRRADEEPTHDSGPFVCGSIDELRPCRSFDEIFTSIRSTFNGPSDDVAVH